MLKTQLTLLTSQVERGPIHCLFQRVPPPLSECCLSNGSFPWGFGPWMCPTQPGSIAGGPAKCRPSMGKASGDDWAQHAIPRELAEAQFAIQNTERKRESSCIFQVFLQGACNSSIFNRSPQ